MNSINNQVAPPFLRKVYVLEFKELWVVFVSYLSSYPPPPIPPNEDALEEKK